MRRLSLAAVRHVRRYLWVKSRSSLKKPDVCSPPQSNCEAPTRISFRGNATAWPVCHPPYSIAHLLPSAAHPIVVGTQPNTTVQGRFGSHLAAEAFSEPPRHSGTPTARQKCDESGSCEGRSRRRRVSDTTNHVHNEREPRLTGPGQVDETGSREDRPRLGVRGRPRHWRDKSTAVPGDGQVDVSF